MPALCLMLSGTYYAQTYAGIIGGSLVRVHSVACACPSPRMWAEDNMWIIINLLLSGIAIAVICNTWSPLDMGMDLEIQKYQICCNLKI